MVLSGWNAIVVWIDRNMQVAQMVPSSPDVLLVRRRPRERCMGSSYSAINAPCEPVFAIMPWIVARPESVAAPGYAFLRAFG